MSESKIFTELTQSFDEALIEYIELFDGEDKVTLKQVLEMTKLVAMAELLQEVKERYGDVIPLTFFADKLGQIAERSDKIREME